MFLGLGLGFSRKKTAFNIANEENLLFWHDPTDASTLTLTGSDVDQIDDKANNTYHLEDQAGNKPTWSATGLNGLGAITFDDTNDAMTFVSSGANFSAITNQATLSFVHNFNPTNTFRNIWQKRDTGGWQIQNDASQDMSGRVYGGSGNIATSPRPSCQFDGSTHIWTIVLDNGNFQLYIDGVAQFSPAFNYSSVGTAITSTAVGTLFQSMNGALGDHWCTTDAKGADKIAEYYAYAQEKWGVA